MFSNRLFGCCKDRKIFLKTLCFTGRKIEASEFLIPMVDIAHPPILPFLLTKLHLWSYSGSVHFNSPEKTPGSDWIKVWVAPELMWTFWRNRMVQSVDYLLYRNVCPDCIINSRQKFKYEIVTVARVVTDIRDVVPCSLVCGCRRFGGTYCMRDVAHNLWRRSLFSQCYTVSS